MARHRTQPFLRQTPIPSNIFGNGAKIEGPGPNVIDMLRLTLSSYGANPVGLDNIVIEPPGSVSGDPHFVTFDGKHYGLQKSGEFTLAKSTDAGDFFSIQVLTSPGRAGRQ
jgi:hypothetical protein